MLRSFGKILFDSNKVLLHFSMRFKGSTLMNEAEFYQWVQRIQSLRPSLSQSDASPEASGSSSASSPNTNDEVGQDLVAAFRVKRTSYLDIKDPFAYQSDLKPYRCLIATRTDTSPKYSITQNRHFFYLIWF